MTKLEYLRSLVNTGVPSAGNAEIIFTWNTLGKNVINESTKIYNKDIIYYVMSNDIVSNNYPLNGCLLYCKKEYIPTANTNFNWNNGKLIDYSFGEISFGNNIVSPYFTLLLTKEEVKIAGGIDIEPTANFIPYKNLNNDTDIVTISDEDYLRCISVLGAPFITEEELEYTREEICNLAIKPALEEYFHWIPSLKVTTLTNNSTSAKESIEVDMPTDAYNVVGVSLQQAGMAANSLSMTPMAYAMEQSLYSGYSTTGVFRGKGYTASGMRNGNAIVASFQNRALSQALINYSRRVHYEGPYTRADGSRFIKVYSTTNGTFNIWWGRRTLDFNDVEYAHRTRVFTYAQACVKELFANIRGQIKSDIPGVVDYKTWIKEAEDTKEKITGEFKKITKSSGILRGSL